jgi:hypothetical protein
MGAWEVFGMRGSFRPPWVAANLGLLLKMGLIALTVTGVVFPSSSRGDGLQGIGSWNEYRLATGAGATTRQSDGSWVEGFFAEATIGNDYKMASLGAAIDNNSSKYFYAEVGVYFVFSLAVGAGAGDFGFKNGQSEFGPMGHLFVGIPMAVRFWDLIDEHEDFFYFEPFYRSYIGSWDGLISEFGVLLKYKFDDSLFEGDT